MEATTTLADALLDDLDDLMDSDDDNDNDDQEQQQEQNRNNDEDNGDDDDDNGDQKPSSSELDASMAKKSSTKSSSSRFLDSPNFLEHLKRIREHAAQQLNSNSSNKMKDLERYRLGTKNKKKKIINWCTNRTNILHRWQKKWERHMGN